MAGALDIDVELPLIVDLDGALTVADTLYESFAKLLFERPLAALSVTLRLPHGRAAFKRALAARCRLDAASLPLRADLVTILRAEKARGRPLHLVSAADQAIVDAVAAELPLFQSATGSDGTNNLKGLNKLAYLRARFTNGFVYAGDSAADLPVFRAARGVVLCDVSSYTAAAVKQARVPVLAAFSRPANLVPAWLRAFRVHQWAKNLLLFVPLFTGHVFGDLSALAAVALGFALLCLLSSGTYIMNDLADLDADRQHDAKRLRPFASGTLKIAHGLVMAPLMVAAALAGAWLLAPPFALALLAYLLLTTAYSFGLKRVPLADVFAIGMLFTLRIVMGAEIAHLTHSPWLLSFALAFFISLALAKRHGEVMRAARVDVDEIIGRGYRGNDWPVTLAFGIGAGLVSIVIMLLYMTNEAAPSGFYRQTAWLYVIPAIITLWLMRVWLLSNRMELHDDPVVFALRDRISLVFGVVAGIAFYFAL
ncbi:MAG TPA: UbiA family prenyltransferase [Xanthobacteraceae bacterium]|nr:UbiA family prenyltransferase [Xanthobacteraceae bacterium]